MRSSSLAVPLPWVRLPDCGDVDPAFGPKYCGSILYTLVRLPDLSGGAEEGSEGGKADKRSVKDRLFIGGVGDTMLSIRSCLTCTRVNNRHPSSH